MLPSTGYFKGIICPFNENGLCERPYCHYRHLDFDESGAILQKLVSAAVLKALQQNDTSGTKSSAQQSQGEAGLNPQTSVASLASKATYNPTPIAELNKINSTDSENLEDPNEQRKRHIPVPYTPRKPAGLPIKRSVDINDPKPFVYNPPAQPLLYKPGSTENAPNDTYTPVGTVESKEKYLPGTEKEIQEYTPDTNAEHSPTKLNYVPSSDKSTNKKKILEYKPAKVVKTDKPSVTYQPTPRSLVPCFSSDEDEPQTKKRKISCDLNGLDDLGPEFDILDQILDEEKPDEMDTHTQSEKSKNTCKDSKKSNGDLPKSENYHKSHHRSKSDKEKSDENYINKSEKRSVDENKKSKSNKRSSEYTHKTSKSDKKSSDENPRKIMTDEDHKSRSDKKITHEKSSEHKNKSEKKSDEVHRSKSDKKSSRESHRSKSDKKTSNDNHKSKSDKKSSDDNHTTKSDRKESNAKDKKEKKHEHKKSSHKSSSKDREKDSKEKHSSDSKKCRSRSTNHSPKHSKKTEKTESRRSSSSKSKEKHHKKSKNKDRLKSDSSDPETLDMEDNGIGSDYDLSDADEDTIALECKRIFEEYVPTEKPKSPDENIVLENQEEEYIPSKKRVSRTIDKNIKVIPRAPVKLDFKVSAANTMAERLSKVREFHNSRNIQSATSNPPVTNEIRDNSKLEVQKTTPSPVPSKIRIAHVPYVSTMLNIKKVAPPSTAPVKLEATSSTTISQTIKKGAQRVAHLPSEKFIDRPGVLEPLASKIPANIRSTYLNMMIDECLKLYLSTHDAYARAQHEELATSKKCSTVPIYKNSAVLAVSRLRKELVECNGVKKTADDCTTLKPGTSLKATNSGSWSIESKNKRKYEDTQEFTGRKFYDNIKKWILTEEQLKENSFPRPHASGQNGRAIIYGQNKQSPPKGFIRTCCRCKKEYTVNKKGFAVVKEECIYHPNRKYRVRGEARYQCCTQDGTADGCCVAPSHVYEYVDFEHLKGYVTTMPPDPQVEDNGVYSLDCEMCYTTSGLELTRVTVINSACKVVYETFVKPLHPIIDYNTRYSGITEEHMSHVKTTLLDVQATLLTMFSSKTILVGHSLESDFKALKLIHNSVIDTSVLFPHKMGPPFKRALRNLSTDYLRKIIQNNVEGHDSAEDAMVCMELLHYKLKEDLKSR